jgi:DUF177 domain-containing protein
MIIDLRSLDRTSGRLSGDVITQLDDPLVGERLLSCRVDVDFRQAHGMVYCHGTVAAAVKTQCHRCLDPVAEQITGEFDLIIRRGEHDGEEADGVVTLGTNEFDVLVDPYVHETVVVNAPMIVVCREDCRGLCPTCGTNLNRSSCSCEQPTDSRWDALKKLRTE